MFLNIVKASTHWDGPMWFQGAPIWGGGLAQTPGCVQASLLASMFSPGQFSHLGHLRFLNWNIRMHTCAFLSGHCKKTHLGMWQHSVLRWASAPGTQALMVTAHCSSCTAFPWCQSQTCLRCGFLLEFIANGDMRIRFSSLKCPK